MIFPGIMRQLPMQALTRGTGLWMSPRRSVLSLCIVMLAVFGVSNIADGFYIKGKASIAQVLLENAWSKTLADDSNVKPWPWADVWPILKISVPRMNEKAIVLSGVSGQAMAFGPGLMAGSPTPGTPGLAIIAAHRDTHFQYLKGVEIGDEIELMTAHGALMSFRIIETKVVLAHKSGLSFEGDTPRLALVTCWPFNATRRGDQRFVVIADLIEK